MSFLMRCALLFIIGTWVVSAQDEEITYIEREYLLIVDNTKANMTDADFTQKLEDFRLKVTAIDLFTTITVFGVTGDADDIERVKRLPGVIAAEQNMVITLAAKRPAKPPAEVPCSVCHKVSATRAWGLDRVDQTNKLLSDDPFNLDADYMIGPHRGAGVVAYVVDTGIDGSHPEFEGRAFCLHSAFTDVGCIDDNSLGHGTHVAGTIGSRRYGVAKEVTLVGVKVFRDFFVGTSATVCNGLSWVLQHHNSRWNYPVMAKSVVNMSFRTSPLISVIVEQLLTAGITAVASAGNSNRDACLQTPASVPGAITVGATTVDDESASFANWGTSWGPCVDLFAPGADVMSTMPGNSVGSLSGTSMAAAHVSGAVAVEMSRRIQPTPPADMHDFIISQSTKNKISFSSANHAKSFNRLLYVPCCGISKKDLKIIADK